MSETRPNGEQDLAGLDCQSVQAARAELRERIVRNEATAQALREYLHAHGAALQERPVLLTTPSPEYVRLAREYARRRCDELDLHGDRRDVLELAVSELVGNAVRHGRPPIVYEITPDGDELRLVVADADPSPPGDGADCGLDGEGGRGLFLISQMARAWGWEPTSDGKSVWVRV